MTGPRRPVHSGDLELQVGADREAYAVGDQIELRASYRNAGPASFALVVNGTNLLRAADHPLALQMAAAPLYSMERLVLTAVLRTGTEARMELRPVWSNMFWIHRLMVLQPGERYDEAALLSSAFWEPADPAPAPDNPWSRRRSGNALRPPVFQPGRYRLEAVYAAAPLSPKDVDKMRRFVPEADTERSVDAFFRLRIMGVSYNDMEIYRSCDFRAWSGTIRTEAFEFEVD